MSWPLRSYVYLVVASLIAAGAAVGMVALLSRDRAPMRYIPGDQGNITDTLPYWEDEVREYGGHEAFKRFSTAVELLQDGQKHSYAHVFGRALYEIEGMPSFDICDTRFQSGCLHQFIGDAVHDRGTSIVREFGERCADLETRALMPGCSHGIGHALIEWFGYDRAGLDSTLAMCDQYFTGMQRWGCLDGAFMEYHLRDISSDGTESVSIALPLTDKNRYEPCRTVGKENENPCFRELPHWWYESFPNVPVDERISKMGGWCRALRDQQREFCMRGIGYLLPAFESDNETYKHLCARVGTGIDVVRCYLGVARRHYMDHPQEKLLCGSLGLHAQERVACETYAIPKS